MCNFRQDIVEVTFDVMEGFITLKSEVLSFFGYTHTHTHTHTNTLTGIIPLVMYS